MVIVYCQECLFFNFYMLEKPNLVSPSNFRKDYENYRQSQTKFKKKSWKKIQYILPKVWEFHPELKGSRIIEYWCHQVRIQTIIQFDTELLLLLLLIILLLEECWMEFNWQMITRHSSWNKTNTTGSPVFLTKGNISQRAYKDSI